VGEVTGLHVLRDFGTLSSPIVLCPLPWTGAIYDALIEDGFERDADLSIDAGWPPLVFGIPAPGAPPAAAAPGPEAVRAALSPGASAARISAPPGIARAWAAAGAGGGIGEAFLELNGVAHVGVFAAVCGPPGSAGAVVPPVRILVLATDAPLGPQSLSALAGQALEGVALAALLEGGAGAAAVAFTTAQAVNGAFEPRSRRISRRELGAPAKGALGDTARECARRACARALER
jgi:hypothetical protein